MSRLKWWQRAIFYQIYPRSFADGNADGIGDFIGMTAKLDYVRDLGIDAIWLSPHYPSPFLDCGYDIADYSAVGAEYGSLADFKTFLDAAHKRGIRIVLDLVLNHSSDQHAWFQESRSSRDNPKRDWYIWRDGQGDDPPNNWASIFGGSAWELDPLTNQYYYHIFLTEQPDLNWRNPELKQAMWDTVRFWLDMGVDGFRLDAIATVFEHPDLPNHTLPQSADAILDANALHKKDYQELLRFQIQQPGVHALMQELRALIDTYPGDRVLIGEDEDLAYHGSGDNELHLVFNFPLMQTARLTPEHIRANQALRLAALPAGAWPCNTLGNHDGQRVWSRYGDGQYNQELARLHLALLLTLKGTPFLFNGEEIGMPDLELQQLSQLRDTMVVRQYHMMTEKMGISADDALTAVLRSTRDRCRSPLHWSDAPHAGFCPSDVTPWLAMHSSYTSGVSVAAQEGDPASLLSFYRNMLHLRHTTPALIAGDYQPLEPYSQDYLAFIRHDHETDQRCLVVLNFSDATQKLSIRFETMALRLLFSSQSHTEISLLVNVLQLRPFEVLIIELLPTA